MNGATEFHAFPFHGNARGIGGEPYEGSLGCWLGFAVKQHGIVTEGLPIPGLERGDAIARRAEVGRKSPAISPTGETQFVGMTMVAAMGPIFHQEIDVLGRAQQRQAGRRQIDTHP